METKVESLEGSQKKITITIDAKEVDDRIKKQYAEFARRYNFPGFRKGKAPRPVIDNVLGKEAVVATVTDDVINSLYPLALDELDIVVAGQPTFDEVDEMVKGGEPFSFGVTVPVRPEYDLDSYEPLTIKLPSAEAEESEVEAQIDELLNYYYTFEDSAANTKAKEGSFVELAMTAKNAEGEEVAALTTDSRLYEIGAGLLPAAFDEQIIGMKKGDTKSFEIEMTSDSLLGRNLGGQTVSFDVEAKQLKERVVPELTDEWARETAGFAGGVAELREQVAASIKQQKEAMLPRLRESETLYALQKRLQGEVPAGLVDAEEAQLMQNFFMQMQQSGMTFDMYLAQAGMTPDSFRKDLKRQARDVANQDFALDAWARNAGIEVTPEEVADEFAKSGADDPVALQEEWRTNGRLPELRAGMRRAKALEAILESLTVEELAEGEKLLSALDAETEDAAEAAEAPAAAASDEAPTKASLSKMKVDELRELAASKGIEAAGLKKAELVDAILAAE